MTSVTRQVARGAGWMLMFKIGERALAIVSTAILARVLTPADFGLVAMAMSLIAGIELFAAFGFDIALIRDREAGRATYDTAWTMSLMASATCAVLLLLLTYPAAQFYRDDRLLGIIPVLAAGTLIAGFENIGTVAFRKEMLFGQEFRFLILKKLAGFLVTVPLAIVFRSYWALIGGMLAGRVAGVALSYVLHSYRPKLALSERRQLFHVSKWLLLNNLLYFLHARLPDFIVGRTSGPRALGFYNAAAEIANLPTSEIVAPINRAIYPGYARHGGDTDLLVGVYLKIAGALWMLAPAAAVGVWLVAEPAVRVLLGYQWGDAVPIVRVLAVAAGLGVIAGNQAYVYMAVGRPFIITWMTIVQVALIFVLALWLVGAYGTIGMAYAMVINASITLPASFGIFMRLTGVGPGKLFAAAWRPAIATGVMAFTVYSLIPAARHPIATPTEALSLLLQCIVLGASAFAVVVLALWQLAGRPDGTERTALDFVRRRFVNRAPTAE